MAKHTRLRITAEQTDSTLFLTTHFPCQSPLSAAAEKTAQLHSLLFMLSNYAACSDTFAALNQAFHSDVLSLAAGIAREAQVMSELAAGYREEAG